MPKPIETGGPNPRTRRAVRWAVVASLLVASIAIEAFAVKIGDTTITLQSRKYYKQWDMTRLKYRLKTNSRGDLPTHWILQLDDCVPEESVLWWASSWFDWVEEPFRGIRFEIGQTNQTYYVWLEGQWDVGEVEIALLNNDPYDRYGGGPVLADTIDGPSCVGSSIAIEVLGGGLVGFAQVLQAGRYDGDTITTLRVTSTSERWSLDQDLALSIPPGAQEDVVRRVFKVTVEPYQPAAGATDIEAAYVVDIDETDLAGLPEGSYVIAVAYTVTADN